MTDFQVSTVDGPAAGWHYNTPVEPDRVIWVHDLGDPLGWTRVSEVARRDRVHPCRLRAGGRRARPRRDRVRGREIHDAAKLSFAGATGDSGKIVAAVLYDANHKCPWWAGLPLIGRRHRCPIWTVDLGQ